MMNGSRMAKLWRKEIIGAIRDRKTFYTFIIMTLLYYPILALGVGWFNKVQTQHVDAQIPSIVVQVAANSQGSPAVNSLSEILSSHNQFRVVHLANPEQALKDHAIQGIAKVQTVGVQYSASGPGFENLRISYEYDPRYKVSSHSLETLQNILQQQSQVDVVKRLAEKGLAPATLTPYVVAPIEAPGTHSSATMLISFVPYLMAIGLVAGGLGLAMDITSGEKERGTIATLLVSALTRTEIAVAKVLTTLTFSVVSIIFTVISLLVSLKLSQTVLGESGSLSLPVGFRDIIDVTVILLPLAFFITSLLVLLGTYARSAKEGQMYAMPVMFLVIIAGGAGTGLDASLNIGTYAIPVLGPLVAIKSLLLHLNNAWTAAVIASISTLVYAIIAISFVVRAYSREDVLFRT